MIKFAICDDEPHMAQALAEQLAGYMTESPRGDYTVGTFASGPALLEAGPFDVILLDVRMAPPDGLETARLLRRRGFAGPLIFVTALREYVFDAFEAEPLDYLVKPLDGERFHRALDRALNRLEGREAKPLVIQRGAECQVVPLSELVYGEVLGRKLYLHRSAGGVVDYYGRLGDLERQVDGRFFRCHRSYLVNLDYVRGCRAGQVQLPEGEAIPVSRLRERELSQALLRRMREGER